MTLETSPNQFVEPMKGWRRGQQARATQLIVEGLQQAGVVRVDLAPEPEPEADYTLSIAVVRGFDPVLDPLPDGTYVDLNLHGWTADGEYR